MRDSRPICPSGRADARHPVVLGLGANLGEPLGAFRAALRALAEVTRIDRISPLYRTLPIGPPQPDFLNAAALIDFPAPLEDLLVITQGIEVRAGRVRAEHWGPRVLDVDILWAGDRTSSTSTLTVPHGELTRRAFALRPMLDVLDDGRELPNLRRYRGILEGLEEQGVSRVEGDNWWEAVPSL